MRIKNLIIIVLIVGVLLTVKFIFFPSGSSEPEAKGGKKEGGAPSNVTAMVLKPEKLSNEVYASGTIMANEEVQLHPELSGKITQLNFEEGGKVFKGQLLIKINDTDLQATYKKLGATYKFKIFSAKSGIFA